MAANRQALTDMKNAIRAAHGFDRKMLPSICTMNILDAAVSFIATYLTAMVLDSLAGGRAFAEIVRVALIGVSVMFILRLISSSLRKVAFSRVGACYFKWENLTGEKSMALDYAQLTDPEIVALRVRMANDRSWGSGIGNSYWIIGDIAGCLSRFVFSIILLAPLFAERALFLNVITAAFIGVAALATIGVNVYKFTRQNRVLAEYMNGHPSSWRAMQEFVFNGFDMRFGKDVRIYGAQTLIRDTVYDPEAVALSKAETARVSKVSGVGGALGGLSDALITGGAYLAASLIYLSGGLTIGAVVRSASGLSQLINGVTQMISEYNRFAVDARRLRSKFEYLEIENEMYQGTIPVEKRLDNDYEIEFRSVSFKYPGSESYALKDLNLKLRVGERMAVVGQNGSGKTTMIKLLCRLYDPTKGEITLNGIDIRKYDQEEYRGIFSVVFQDFTIFALPLGQNVAASASYDKGEVRNALSRAGFDARLKGMDRGLDTPLYKSYDDDGIEISGGEAQKVALARALYKGAPFVVLDEPTAALDPIAEFDIYSRFDDIVGDRTAIYISHRLSSCRFCQDIAVFDEGRLIQRGSHDELVAQEGGKYAELWGAQAQYYTGGQGGEV